MSIDRWNKDASAHARIDALEKQIEDLKGYKLSHTLRSDCKVDPPDSIEPCSARWSFDKGGKFTFVG